MMETSAVTIMPVGIPPTNGNRSARLRTTWIRMAKSSAPTSPPTTPARPTYAVVTICGRIRKNHPATAITVDAGVMNGDPARPSAIPNPCCATTKPKPAPDAAPYPRPVRASAGLETMAASGARALSSSPPPPQGSGRPRAAGGGRFVRPAAGSRSGRTPPRSPGPDTGWASDEPHRGTTSAIVCHGAGRVNLAASNGLCPQRPQGLAEVPPAPLRRRQLGDHLATGAHVAHGGGVEGRPEGLLVALQQHED